MRAIVNPVLAVGLAFAFMSALSGEAFASGNWAGSVDDSGVRTDTVEDVIVLPQDGSSEAGTNGSSREGQTQNRFTYVSRVVPNNFTSSESGRNFQCLHGIGPTGLVDYSQLQLVPLLTVRIDNEQGTEEVVDFTCTTESDAADLATDSPSLAPIVVTRHDFARLPVEAAVSHAGPLVDYLPVGMVNVLYAEDATQTLETSILGSPVSVRAIPVSYHWDLGDGNTITTEKPGEPYPSEQVSSTYSYEGWYDITLTTTFRGEFSVDGGPWQEIDGTIEVASEPRELFSKSLESRLVNPDVPVDEDEDPWIPPRTEETEGPRDPDAEHRTI